jgi:uncharacterized integral membrane protein
MSSTPVDSPARNKKGIGSWFAAVPIRTWLALVIIVLALVFVLQNRREASIYLFNVSITAPLWMTLLITLVVGVVVGLLAHRRRRDRT